MEYLAYVQIVFLKEEHISIVPYNSLAPEGAEAAAKAAVFKRIVDYIRHFEGEEDHAEQTATRIMEGVTAEEIFWDADGVCSDAGVIDLYEGTKFLVEFKTVWDKYAPHGWWET